jgi:hypothetical protein
MNILIKFNFLHIKQKLNKEYRTKIILSMLETIIIKSTT